MSLLNITGQRFGRLTAVERVDKQRWKLICDCGGEAITASGNILNGHTQSCGCYCRQRNSETHRKHGMSKTKVHNAWLSMRDRVDDPKCEQYPNYGGRGIHVCDEWRGDNGFEAFYAHIGDPPSSKHSLDRIDVNGHYEPGNVRWATPKEQMNNKRANRIIEAFGRTMNLSQWAEERLIDAHTIALRLKKGWPIEKALILPAKVWSYELRKFIRPSSHSSTGQKIVTRFVDISGQKYGMLTALDYVGTSKWRFRCDCGRDTVADGVNVRSGHTKSCGCLRSRLAA